jgi:hypothetical protein
VNGQYGHSENEGGGYAWDPSTNTAGKKLGTETVRGRYRCNRGTLQWAGWRAAEPVGGERGHREGTHFVLQNLCCKHLPLIVNPISIFG